MVETGTLPAVFLVDDAGDVRFLFRIMLEKAGYAVIGEASSGEEALALAPGLAPAVVLVDMILPDMSGLEVTRSLQAALPASRILICSGNDDPKLKMEARAAGAHGWVDKSSASSLVPTVEQALAGSDWSEVLSR